MEMNNSNGHNLQDEQTNRLIEEAVEGLREGSVNLDKIIQKYKGDNIDGFLDELTDALAMEEIFREYSGRTRPIRNKQTIMELETSVKNKIFNWNAMLVMIETVAVISEAVVIITALKAGSKGGQGYKPFLNSAKPCTRKNLSLKQAIQPVLT